MTTSRHAVTFPGESTEYRSARNRLLEAEIELRRNIESVAAQRRKLPLGGELREDYEFDEPGGKKTRLSELFADGKDSLIIYSFMNGPEMKAPCPLCTSILDGLDGQSIHVNQIANFAVVAKNPIERVMELAKGRGWRNLRLVSSAGNTYNHDYQGENAKGNQMPALNVFTRRDGRICHSYCTELLFVPAEPGQDGRHVDMIWPLWNLLDYTPGGRGGKWNPKLTYNS